MSIDPKPPSPPDPAGRERRQGRRIEVRVNLSGQVSSSRVQLVNIAEGGCLVYASCLLKVGEIHTFRFRSAPEGGEQRFRGRVVHVVEVTGDPDTVCVVGVEFVDDGADQRRAIGWLLNAASGS